MTSRLPPLNALRAFEAAGRNESFAKAAEELFVTPGAISRQIRSLEEHFGFPLFHRRHREVKLTSEAAAYLETLTDVFAQMDRATHRLIDARKTRLLHIHTAMTFTLRWLLPRLSSFHAKHPKSEIRLSTALPTAAELGAAPTDVAIHNRTQAAVEATSTLLMSHRLVDVELIPVCTEKYRRDHLGSKPASLDKATLLHSLVRPNDWVVWLGGAGAERVDAGSGIKFESSSLAYQAALEDIGVAVAIRAFVQSDLEAGRLITPFDLDVRDGSAFYLTYSKAAAKLPQIVEFRDWIIADARERIAVPHLNAA